MIRAVFLDIDDTVYSYQTGHRYAYQALQAYAEHHFAMDGSEFDSRIQRIMADYLEKMGGNCAAVHNRLIRFQQFLEELGLPLSHAVVMERLYWDTLLAHMEPAPGLLEAVDGLKRRGVLVGIGTNMTADWQYEKLARLGLLDRIDLMVSSEEAGVEKPDPALFLLCAQKAHCPPQVCLFVGDSLSHDVKGAMRAGMGAVWYRPSPSPEDCVPEGAMVIDSLSQLPALLDTLSC